MPERGNHLSGERVADRCRLGTADKPRPDGSAFRPFKPLRSASFVSRGVVDVKYFDHLASAAIEHLVGIPDQWRNPNARPVGHFLGALREVANAGDHRSKRRL